MKKLFLALVFSVFMGSTAFALLDDNSTNATGGTAVTGPSTATTGSSTSISSGGRSDADARSDSDAHSNSNANSSNHNAANQGQEQSQHQQANNSGVNPTNTTEVTTKTEVHTFNPAMTPAAQGTDNMNASTPLGNIGLSSTKKYIVIKELLATIGEMKNAGYITDEEAKSEAREALANLKAETRRKRVLFLPMTERICDNSITNLIPLICE